MRLSQVEDPFAKHEPFRALPVLRPSDGRSKACPTLLWEWVPSGRKRKLRGLRSERRDEVGQGVGSLTRRIEITFSCRRSRVAGGIIEKRTTQVLVIHADALRSMRSRSVNADEEREVRMAMLRSAAAKVREVVLCGRSGS